jgi:hypothetical protein
MVEFDLEILPDICELANFLYLMGLFLQESPYDTYLLHAFPSQ